MPNLGIDSSSLVDLKAEVFRKQQEVNFNKCRVESANDKHKGKNVKNIWKLKNNGVDDRMDKDEEQLQKQEVKSKNILAQKCRLYDDIKAGYVPTNGLRDRFLVNFENLDSSDCDEYVENQDEVNSEDEWVEYNDSLGRTRTCMKKDLSELKQRDAELGSRVSCVEKNNENTLNSMSETSRHDLMRKKWEKEEEENLRKRNIYYGDVLFNEARVHGTGFYAFSRDNASRLAEQEKLADRHSRTNAELEKRKRLSDERQKAMKLRLNRVRRNKRMKMGLSVDDLEIIENACEDEEVKLVEKKAESDILDGLRKIRDTLDEEERKRKFVRQWDVGKDGVPDLLIKGDTKKVLSQDEWVKMKRKERISEFAPPSNTFDNKNNSYNNARNYRQQQNGV